MTAKGYWIAHIDITDGAAFGAYRDFVVPFLAANGGRFIVRAGAQSIEEGVARALTIVVEFPSFELAQRVYHSDDYQRGLLLRTRAGTTDFVIVEGVEG